MSFQEVVGCDDVCADYSDHLWLMVEEVVIGFAGVVVGACEEAVIGHVTDACECWR